MKDGHEQSVLELMTVSIKSIHYTPPPYFEADIFVTSKFFWSTFPPPQARNMTYNNNM